MATPLLSHPRLPVASLSYPLSLSMHNTFGAILLTFTPNLAGCSLGSVTEWTDKVCAVQCPQDSGATATDQHDPI